jgi:hypothetical protein
MSRWRESHVFFLFFSHSCETRAKHLRTRTRYAGGFVGGTVAAPRGAALGGGYGDPNGYAPMQRAPSQQQQQPQYQPTQGSSDRGRQGGAEETGFFDRHPGVGARARGGGGGGGGGGAGAGAGGHQGESYGDELRRQMAEQAARKQTAVKGRRKQEQDDEVSVCAHVRPRA